MMSLRSMGLGSGAIIALLGIVLFVFPAASMAIIAMLVGFGIIVTSANTVIMWARNLRGTGTGGFVLATGILGLLFGFLCLLEPLVFAEAMTWIIAIAVIFIGISQIGSIISMKDVSGKALGIVGSLLIVLLGIFSFIWPPFFMQFMGISLLIEGATIIGMSLMVPRA